MTNEGKEELPVIDHRCFLNRELSWLSFNERVLEEAVDSSNPLLEKLNFLAITGSNLDEFFMIRVAGLMHQRAGGIERRDNADMTPAEQLQAIGKSCSRLVARQYAYWEELKHRLREEGLRFQRPQDLQAEQLRWLADYFERTIFPVVTPLAVDASHPFPFLQSRSLNLAVLLTADDGSTRVAILPVPSVLPRILEIPSDYVYEGGREFVWLEDVLRYWAEDFFRGYRILVAQAFRVTRDSDLDIDEEGAEDLLAEVEKSLKMRRRGAAVRMEIEPHEDKRLREFLAAELHLGEDDIYTIDGPLDMTQFFGFTGIDGYEHLRYPPFRPQTPYALLQTETEGLFAQIRERDLFVHLPYESFDIVERFVGDAAADPAVLAIKQTLYRVSSDSPIVRSLAMAAENGKQVTVLMEVKARFDEENNILMGRRLEQAGAHVIYGLKGVKTHSKCTLVIRREADGIRRYVHVGTGNYNGKTAKLYTDCGIFTCNDQFGIDASNFFNLLSGYSDPPEWNKFIVAPMDLRRRSMELIDREIQHARRGEPAAMKLKMNSLLDKEIILKLYEASQAGVSIDCVVRGICVLKPGIPGVSENIRVRSIIGRFLEHSRIFWFLNGGRDEVYISSADWMPRNLNDRVELMIPVEEERHRERLLRMLDTELADNQKAHRMNPDGTYTKTKAETDRLSAQQAFLTLAKERNAGGKPTLRQRMTPFYRDGEEERFD
ncbi:MAG: polyphosphate kinase 1 [Veillonellaceae bacterium]|nr:polyphosphate kinase 1 [Veillonellaceae bacterium]